MSNNKYSESRNKLREQTLGRNVKFRKKFFDYFPPILEDLDDGSVEVTGYEEDPIQVEFRQPTVRERNDLVKACRDENGFDELEFIVQCAIRFTHDPASGEKLYEPTDYDVLISQPSGGFPDQFGS